MARKISAWKPPRSQTLPALEIEALYRLRARLVTQEGHTHLSQCSPSRRILGGRNGG